MNKWPDGTPKSSGNAFDWRGGTSVIARDPSIKASEAAKRAVKVPEKQTFTIYSKKRKSK